MSLNQEIHDAQFQHGNAQKRPATPQKFQAKRFFFSVQFASEKVMGLGLSTLAISFILNGKLFKCFQLGQLGQFRQFQQFQQWEFGISIHSLLPIHSEVHLSSGCVCIQS